MIRIKVNVRYRFFYLFIYFFLGNTFYRSILQNIIKIYTRKNIVEIVYEILEILFLFLSDECDIYLRFKQFDEI